MISEDEDSKEKLKREVRIHALSYNRTLKSGSLDSYL